MCFTKRLNSIDSLTLTYYKKQIQLMKMWGVSSQESSRSVDVIQAERGSQLVCFLLQKLLYLLLTIKYDVIINKTAIPYSEYLSRSLDYFTNTTKSF